MGRGDRKTKKGKIAIRSYGNKRPTTAATVAGAAKGPAVKKTGIVDRSARVGSRSISDQWFTGSVISRLSLPMSTP